MSRLEKVIDSLLSHETSKWEAIESIRELCEEASPKGAIDFEVTEHGSVGDKYYLKLVGYHPIKDKFKNSTYNCVSVMPKL